MPETKIQVLADTSFLIRLLKEGDTLHENAIAYFKYILENSGSILCSTIAISEYCVKGKLEELPLKQVQVVPFNTDHAVKAAEFARICYSSRIREEVSQRIIIPNDCKLLAQAEIESVQFFLTSDVELKKIFETLSHSIGLKFKFVDINIPAHETFGYLDL